jgi:hypothetical protein
MSTLDLTKGGTTGVSENAIRKHILFTNTIDFSGTHMVDGSPVANAIIVTDLAQIIAVPAGFFCLGVGVRLDTVQGATCTCVFGDGATADGWIDTAFDLDGTALDTSFTLVSDAFGALGGKLYHVADTIDLDPGHTVDAAVITFFAHGFMIN